MNYKIRAETHKSGPALTTRYDMQYIDYYYILFHLFNTATYKQHYAHANALNREFWKLTSTAAAAKPS